MFALTELTATIRNESRKGLRQAMDEWGEKCADSAWQNRNARVLAHLPVYVLSFGDITCLWETIDGGDVKSVAAAIRNTEEQLSAAIGGQIPTEIGDRQEWGLRLVTYVSGVFTPAVAYLGELGLTVHAMQRLQGLITGRRFREVIAAANEGPRAARFLAETPDPAMLFRFLLLAPMYSSLCAFFPSVE